MVHSPLSERGLQWTGPVGGLLRGGLLCVAIAVIFATDTLTHYEIAIPVLYTIVILCAAFASRALGIVALALFCLALTGVSFLFTLHGNLSTGLVNLAISSAAIIVTACLAIRMQHAKELALQGQARLTRIAHAQMVSGLASSLVHELNQPLAAVTMSGQACQRWLSASPPNPERAQAALERIVRDATRAADILSRMSGLTRGKQTERQAFAMTDALGDVIAMSRHSMERHGIVLRLRDRSGGVPAFGDAVQIQQVASNLLLNAVEAIAGTGMNGGHIDILVWCEEDRVLCRVSDNGAGIARHLANHLFEPFWTTKAEGTGIGLAISRTLIEANDGGIWLAENHDRGAAFCFSIPMAREGGCADATKNIGR